jgi:clan AA aspartic protease
LLQLLVSNASQGEATALTAWIDTAFDGSLVFPRQLVQELKLTMLAETEAILADGSKVTLQTYVCFAEWFGSRVPLEVVANDGRFPLLGTAMLKSRVLHIDYPAMKLSID